MADQQGLPGQYQAKFGFGACRRCCCPWARSFYQFPNELPFQRTPDCIHIHPCIHVHRDQGEGSMLPPHLRTANPLPPNLPPIPPPSPPFRPPPPYDAARSAGAAAGAATAGVARTVPQPPPPPKNFGVVVPLVSKPGPQYKHLEPSAHILVHAIKPPTPGSHIMLFEGSVRNPSFQAHKIPVWAPTAVVFDVLGVGKGQVLTEAVEWGNGSWGKGFSLKQGDDKNPATIEQWPFQTSGARNKDAPEPVWVVCHKQ